MTFVSSKLASLVFLFILYNFHEGETWKMYSLYLINISLFRNITFSFTSNLGHEGLLSRNNTDYKKLFSVILFIVFALQTIGLVVYFIVGDNEIFIYSYLFAVISSLQGIIQNFHRFSLEYNEYSKTTLLFSFGNLIAVAIFYFNSLEVYLTFLILISLLLLLKYYKLLIDIIKSFDFEYFKDNIKKLSVSSLKLYLINTFPDSLFLVYVPLIFADFYTDVDYTALVFLIALFGVKSYPLITLIIQENMDYIKKFHNKKNYFINLLNNFTKKESIVILIIMTSFLTVELFYITFFAKPLMIIFAYFGLIFWILPLVFLRHFINSIIEVKKDIKYKFSSFLFSIILLYLIFYFDKINIFSVILIYWFNLIHLTFKHIKSNFLNFNLFYKFYISYFIIGSLFHFNYYLNLDINNILNINSYLSFSVIILSLIMIYNKTYLLYLLANYFKKIKI